jgi:hypothetical protein
MSESRVVVSLLIVALAGLLPWHGASAKMYRWVDESGKVHYTDKMPPEQIEKGHDELNEQGLTVKSVDRAKTREEYERELELERLRKEQQRLLAEQRAADQVLLRTFRNEEDIRMARDGQIASVDAQTLVIKSNIKNLKKKLSDLQQQAADYERGGRNIPVNLEKSIQITHSSLDAAYESVIAREQDKERITQKFGKDLARFIELKRHMPQDEERERLASQKPLEGLDYVIYCPVASACDAPWERVESFVAKHASMPIQITGKKIVMTQPPLKQDDISIAVSRINKKNLVGDVIFLDVQCRDTPRGQELCRGERVEGIRKAFKRELQQN